MSFSAFYSRKQIGNVIKTTSHLLPLIHEHVQCPATVRHAVNQIKQITSKINPEQKYCVVTGDEPVYAIGKQTQWAYPNEFNNVIWMMGPLHIEKNFIEAIGDWLEGSGWVEMYVYSKITTSGKPDGFLNCSGKAGIKQARYAHQVTLAVLISLARSSFEEQSDFAEYSAWKEHIESNYPTAKYWFHVIDMEILLFMFLRSLRESNFEMFLTTFEEMLPWLAALDHINYVRWGSVFLDDMKHLPEEILGDKFVHRIKKALLFHCL